MKKTFFLVCLMLFSVGAFAATDTKNPSDKTLNREKTENKLSAEELSRLTRRVEEIRDMDKSDLTIKEKRELRKEMKAIRETVKKDGGYIYIGAGTLLVVILLVILLL